MEFLPQLRAFYQTIIRELSREDRREVTQGLALVLGSVPLAKLQADLQEFLLPLAEELHAIANTDITGFSEDQITVKINELRCTLALFRKTKY